MKRIISLVFALFLALSTLGFAAAEGVAFKTDYYTMTLPRGWEIDTDDTGVEEEDRELRQEYLGFCYDSRDVGLAFEAYLVFYKDSDLQAIQLWNANEAEKQAYADGILETFEDDEPVFLGFVMADRIPFIVIKATDEDGDYLYAETMSNGYALVFYAYVFDGEDLYPITDQYMEQFKSILETFTPVT